MEKKDQDSRAGGFYCYNAALLANLEIVQTKWIYNIGN